MTCCNIIKMILAVAIVIMASCTKTETPQIKDSDNNFPDTRLDDATIVLTQDGRQNVVLEAEHIDRWEKNDSTEAEKLKVIFYDKLGAVRSTLNADRGLIREKTEEIAMFGNVVAVSKDSTVLRTQSLFWNPQTELITTDDYVEIEQPDGNIMTGYGLKTDSNLEKIEILSDVSGKVMDIIETDKEDSVKQ